MYSGERWARSIRIPEATKTLRMPGTSRLSFISSTSGPWSVPRSLQTLGWTQREPLALRLDLGLGAAHLVHVGRRAADVGDDPGEAWDPGPITFSSLRIDSFDRDWMIRPWWAVIEQKVQPPKQPRMIVTESLTVSNAGIRSPLYIGCGLRV